METYGWYLAKAGLEPGSGSSFKAHARNIEATRLPRAGPATLWASLLLPTNLTWLALVLWAFQGTQLSALILALSSANWDNSFWSVSFHGQSDASPALGFLSLSKAVVPLHLHHEAEAPSRISSPSFPPLPRYPSPGFQALTGAHMGKTGLEGEKRTKGFLRRWKRTVLF